MRLLTAFRNSICIALVLLFANNAISQNRDFGAGRLLLDDGAGHIIRISVPTTGWGAPGIYDWVLPIPPAGVDAGFVEMGSLANQFLQWNDALQYWEAVPSLAGVAGTGTMNTIPKWNPAGTSLVDSKLSDNGSTISSTNSALLFSGSTGATPASGAGTRMMWIPAKSAFRAGIVSSTQFDDANIGFSSIAMGENTIASAFASTSFGQLDTASAPWTFVSGSRSSATANASTAMGYEVRASGIASFSAGWSNHSGGQSSTTIGQNNVASGNWSVALGGSNRATGLVAIAIGNQGIASGNYAATIGGDLDTASGSYSLAVGNRNHASGAFSIASGQYSTATGDYSLVGGYNSYALGQGSVALGIQTRASGNRSVALNSLNVASGHASLSAGENNVSSGSYSVTLGGSSVASGVTAVAIGNHGIASANFSATIGGDYDTASGPYSIAGGLGSHASGFYSKAFGYYSVASGTGAFAQGLSNIASGDGSVALGDNDTASNFRSIAMGFRSKSSGQGALAMGLGAKASGGASVSLGYQNEATGDYSVALGARAKSDGFSGCFAFADGLLSELKNTALNQFMVRASGGTIFYSNAAASVGVSLAAGGNSWASISDSNRKENRLNIDGENVLNKISNMWLGSWNYKGQDAKSFRHYGPMAQEFFAAFGNDGIGISGNETTLSSADVDGINMIAIKALIARTEELQKQVQDIRTENASLRSALRELGADHNSNRASK